ncbi:ORF6N domain-containing protein [Symbiopectobacterium purcellii]|uniref:ORF6N domain-containing protein n=1 Tax=Symbiopectobacterium purcellii TaxID=2871826 RepID=UPI003F828840
MTQIITIQNTQLPVIEYQSQRVITTELLAQGYRATTQNIRQNFNNNKSRFVEGKHYFQIDGEELNTLRVEIIDAQISSKSRTLTLWTERGASRHAKMLETDQAWEWYEALEDNYFRLREQKSPVELGLPNFLDPAEAAIAWGEERKVVQLISFERDEAIRTKAEIGSRREASAMATASVAVRERNKLAARLGECTKHATVLAVMNKTGKEYPWRPLRKWCAEHDVSVIRVPDARYGIVNAWPAKAWITVHGINLPELFGEVHHV